MEQILWVYMAVIAVVVGLAIIFNLFGNYNESDRLDALASAVEKLTAQCDLVCKSADGTKISGSVRVPSGGIIETSGTRICGILAGERKCMRCDCVLNDFELDLNTTLARRTFRSHEYKCHFQKQLAAVEIDCQG